MGIKFIISAAQAKADCTFTENNLDDAMIRQSALFSHYGVLSASAQRQMNQCENVLEVTKARIANEIRAQAAATGEKITEAKISQEVILDERVQNALKDYNDSIFVWELARQTLEALKQRRDMLVQVCKRQAEEREGQARVSITGSIMRAGAAAIERAA